MRQSHLHRFLVAYKESGAPNNWGNHIYTQDSQDLTEQSMTEIAQEIRSKEKYTGVHGEREYFHIVSISYLGKSLPTDFATEAWKQASLPQRERGRLI